MTGSAGATVWGSGGGPRFALLRPSTLLLLAAAATPERRGAGWLVVALIRGYRRWLTRFTPPFPSTPSCSAYALDTVTALGARRGLVAAAHRLRACGGPRIRTDVTASDDG